MTVCRRNIAAVARVARGVALLLCSSALLCWLVSTAAAQQLSVVIQVKPELRRAIIEGSCAANRIWSFRNSNAGVSELGIRIEQMEVSDAAGVEIPVRKIAPGQFESASPASRFRYQVNLNPPGVSSEAARVSWLNTERGLLMLADLLPVFESQAPASGTNNGTRGNSSTSSESRVAVKLDLPRGWSVYSNEIQNGLDEFVVTDADSAVFAIGNRLRSSRTAISGMTLSFVSDGDWAFTDGEGLELAGKVLKAHHEVIGSMPSKQAMLILFPFPQNAAASKWCAETRGSTVTLLMGRLPSKVAALAQLSTPLTHELFHFWVPNALALDGDYDWFYEGFTIYQAARAAVRLNLLTFQEFLNAMGRAYDAYASGVDRDRWSLIEASKRRWTVGESVVYQKSMLIAFLYDLKLRSESHGKHSLDDVYRDIFRQSRSLGGNAGDGGSLRGRGSDGNDAAISALVRASGMQDFAQAFIQHAVAIDLRAELDSFGLRVERLGLRTHVSVNESLTRPQRDLLRELGYNDYMRSSTQKRR